MTIVDRYWNVPTRCEVCGKLEPCGNSFCRKQSDGHPLDAARGVLYGALIGLLAWGLLVGFLALIFFDVHV